MINPLTRLHLSRIVVAVDPAVTSTSESDHTGIIVAGLGRDGDGYILDDLTCRLSPDGWAKRVAYGFHKWQADRVVAESNNGGELLSSVLRTVDPGLPVKLVHASRGKQTRAEPVAALYEQGRIHHVGVFPELEDQACVAAGTMVFTDVGDVPIEDIHVGDRVWTRAGWKPVLWSGQTGIANCMEITTASGHRLRCTVDHPIWVEGQGFRPAAEVQSLARCLSLSPANTSNTEASSTSGLSSPAPTKSIGVRHESKPTAASRCCCTECSMPKSMGRSQMAGKSTTRMRTDSTTTSTISSRSAQQHTSESIRREVFGTRPLMNAASGVSKSGRGSNRMPSPACRAGRSSSARVSEPCSALVSVVAATTPASAATEPVYNLTVADQPEFFANGLLVHNCTWVPGAEDSPDRVDALVWALTELMLHAGGTGAPVFTRSPSRWKIN